MSNKLFSLILLLVVMTSGSLYLLYTTNEKVQKERFSKHAIIRCIKTGIGVRKT